MILDIETIGDAGMPAELEPSADSIEAPSNYKDPEKIAKYKEEKLKDMKGMLGLSPLTGKIVCFGTIGMTDAHADAVILRPEDDYREFLKELDRRISECMWSNGPLVTFNGKAFDIPFIFMEIARMGISSTVDWGKLTRKYVRESHVDLFELFGNKGSLYKWSLRYGVDTYGKDRTTGADVGRLYAEGKYEDIKIHCEEDVQTTEALYSRFAGYLL